MRNRSIWEGVLGYAVYQAWAVALGALWFRSWIGKSGSPTANILTGKTAGLNNHGEWFYVYPWQKSLFNGALFGSVLVFIVALAMAQHRLGKSALMKLRPLSLILALSLAVIMWTTVARFGEM